MDALASLYLPAASEMKSVDLHDVLARELTERGVPEVEATVEAVMSQVRGRHAIIAEGHRFVDQGHLEVEPPGPFVVPV